MSPRKTLLLVLALSIPGARAEMDAATRDALEKTQQMLADPTKREEAIARDPNAKAVDERVKSLGLSPQDQEALYRLSSGIFKSMVEGSSGETDAMKAKMDALARDPASIGKELTPEQRNEIQRLSGTIEPRAKPAP
jgi:hypothetical protein